MNKADQHKRSEEIHTQFVKCIRRDDDIHAIESAALSIIVHCLEHYESTDQIQLVANIAGFFTEQLFFDHEKAQEFAELIKAELENRVLTVVKH